MSVDWHAMLAFTVSPLEIVLRGTVMYVGLFVLLRVALKRAAGALSMTDLLVIVLIADAAQNGMASDYKSIGEGLLLVGTIVFWSWALDWLGYHVPAVQRLVHPPPLPLVRDGVMQRRSMRAELVTPDELWSALREAGVRELTEVKLAQIEGDGQISVVKTDARGSDDAPDRKSKHRAT